ncbi:MAG: 3-deoxy-D-manno-octulosonic acid transferase [Pseudomonadota bacterium]
MIRPFYSLVMRALTPLVRQRLAKRGRAEPGSLLALDERFGHYSQAAGRGFVWIHAVSLGETRAAAVLVARLRERLPGMRLLLTHGTATGRAEGVKLQQPGDVQVWQPWDTPGAVARFLAQFKPRIGLLMETEIWPNLIAGCQQAGVPLVLANARMSEKSQRQAQRLAWLSRPAFGALSAVWAQTPADAERLTQLGAPAPGVFGNLKFDATPNAAQLATGRLWRSRAGRPVVMFASSREGEELDFLQFLESFRPLAPVGSSQVAINSIANEVQWLIVPRHPQRFDEVARLIESYGFAVSRRSTWPDGPPAQASTPARSIWLGDSLGEMVLYYGLSDVALLGGSFEPLGGQNLIEAAICACPLVMGPHTFNFAEAAELAESAGAALRVDTLPQAVEVAQTLANDAGTRDAMVSAAAAFASAHRGAVEKTVAAVLALLEQQGVDAL